MGPDFFFSFFFGSVMNVFRPSMLLWAWSLKATAGDRILSRGSRNPAWTLHNVRIVVMTVCGFHLDIYTRLGLFLCRVLFPVACGGDPDPKLNIHKPRRFSFFPVPLYS